MSTSIVQRIQPSAACSTGARRCKSNANSLLITNRKVCNSRQGAIASVVCFSKRKEEEDRLYEQMKAEINKTDIWENEFVGIATSVLGVAVIVGFIVIAGYLAQPIVTNTINSFPSA